MQRIDHIYLETNDPRTLFNILVEELRLPVAWPIQDYGSFVSGGVSLGNLNLEVARFTGQTNASNKVNIRGIALAPHSLQAMMNDLRERDVTHDEPIPFEIPQGEGAQQLLWTNVDFPTVLSGLAHVFACAYAFDMSGMNTQNQTQLQSDHGGELGIIKASSLLITIDAAQLEAQRTAWSALLGEEPSADLTWGFKDGPMLHLEPGETNVQLKLSVSNPDHAIRKLKELGLELPFLFDNGEA